jgi:hypothetical protein
MNYQEPAFPDTYNDIDVSALLGAYEKGPQRLRQVMRGLARVDLMACPIKGKWSIQEIAIHLAGVEDMDADGLDRAPRLFQELQASTAPVFRTAGADDRDKIGYHPGRGVMTLHQLLELYADHSERHIGQILERRAILDKWLDFPLLLEKRLY